MEHEKKHRGVNSCDSSSLVWVLGAVGAAVYFVQGADTFWSGVVGVLKALVWPAYVVYYLLQSFGL